jgi:hypothetical protein
MVIIISLLLLLISSLVPVAISTHKKRLAEAYAVYRLNKKKQVQHKAVCFQPFFFTYLLQFTATQLGKKTA